MSTADTHLKKLDIFQRKAARIICPIPRDSHSESLMKPLNVDFA